MAEEVNSNKTKKTIMVAMDGSKCSEYALEWTLDHLTDYISSSSSSSLFIYTAHPISDYGYLSSSSSPLSPELVRAIEEQQKKVSSELMKKAKDICATRGVSLNTVVGVGDAKEAICEAVEKFNINLLVMGSHGKGAIKRLFLGSVSNYCVHHANCPVLVVKKPA